MTARLDNFAIQLQQDPVAQAYLVGYSKPGLRKNYGRELTELAKNYLISTRGIDASRIVTVDGGSRNDLTIHLWVVSR